MKSPVGPIMQVAYVVENLDAAINDFAVRLGAGPFFVRRNVSYASASYLGEATDAVVSLAFAYAGDINIELIQLENDAPSIFRDHVRAHGFGQQHLGILSDDIERDTKRLEESGMFVAMHMVNKDGVDTRLFGDAPLPGTTLELIAASPTVIAGFAHMKKAASQWDGIDAIAS